MHESFDDRNNHTMNPESTPFANVQSSKTQRKFYDQKRLIRLSRPKELPKIVNKILCII